MTGHEAISAWTCRADKLQILIKGTFSFTFVSGLQHRVSIYSPLIYQPNYSTIALRLLADVEWLIPNKECVCVLVI